MPPVLPETAEPVEDIDATVDNKSLPSDLIDCGLNGEVIFQPSDVTESLGAPERSKIVSTEFTKMMNNNADRNKIVHESNGLQKPATDPTLA